MSTTNMTPERLAEIEKRCNEASKAPWFCALRLKGSLSPYTVHNQAGSEICSFEKPSSVRVASDATFIAHARQDIPDLIAKIKRLTAELAKVEKGRGMLAVALGEQSGQHNICDTCPCMCSQNDCAGDWLQWAARQMENES